MSDGGGSLEAMAAEAFRRLRKAVRRLGGEPSGEALHEIRIKAKRARYAAELVAPVVGKPAERFVEHAKAFQDLLGDCQDALIAQQKLREIATRTRGPAAALVAGRLIE